MDSIEAKHGKGSGMSNATKQSQRVCGVSNLAGNATDTLSRRPVSLPAPPRAELFSLKRKPESRLPARIIPLRHLQLRLHLRTR